MSEEGSPKKGPRRAALLAVVLACIAAAPRSRAAAVGAASSLSSALIEAAEDYAANRRETAPALHFAASGEILAQLRHGAPIDAVIFADRETAETALAEGLVEKDSIVVAQNRIVMAVAAPLAETVRCVSDLARPEVRRVVVGNPKYVPVGRYALGILRRAGVLERVSGRLVTAGSAKQATQVLESGEADAALLFATDAGSLRSGGFALLPVADSPVAPYLASLVAGAGHKAEAAAFLEYLASPEGASHFRRFGFEAGEAATPEKGAP